jgi:Glycine cleavage system protein P (pyridoxal-binding), C-terminal domain
VPEFELIRHFTELSTRNFGVDTGFYPLGSCTMKYNPRINERLAALPGFARLIHCRRKRAPRARSS